MSCNPFAAEIVNFESEKFEELVKEIKAPVANIKAQLTQIKFELQKYRDDYSLDFEDDVFNYLKQIIFNNL